jgi:glycosyltransferase involved in cell wall biosynthesis
MLRHLMARFSTNMASILRRIARAQGGAKIGLDHPKLDAPLSGMPGRLESPQLQSMKPGTPSWRHGSDQAQEKAARSRIIFDISDLIQYLGENRVPTGIQRVQLNIIHYAIVESRDQVNPIIVYFERKRNDWLHLTEAEFLTLYRAAEAHEGLDEETFLALLEAMAERECLVSHLKSYPQQDDFILVNLGTSWWIENYFLKIRELRNHCSLCYVPMIHDCIPLMVPEHCADALAEEFRIWFAGVCLEADAVLTNSHWSRNDIGQELKRLDPEANIPIHPVALNGDMSHHLVRRSLTMEDPLRHVLPDGASFVLCVATLEGRKNHLLLFKAWHRLMENHAAGAIPHLLCLGRAGWLFEEAEEYLRANPSLHERILLVSSVTDAALATLYQNCLFSVFNSLYEGWGLPITESLSFGALPLVASNTSLTEAGGEAAVYFRGDDPADLYVKLEKLIFDTAYREKLRDHARTTAQIRPWSSVADEMLRLALETQPAALSRQGRFLIVPTGDIISLGKAGADTPFRQVALRSLLRDGLNWHRPEEWGCWIMPGTASIRLMLPDNLLGRDISVFIRFRGPAFPTKMLISISAEGGAAAYGPMERMIGSGKRLTLRFNMRTEAKELRLKIDCGAGSSLGPNDRDVGVGVTHIMVCGAGESQASAAFVAAFPELHQASWTRRRRSFQNIEVPHIRRQC